MSVPQTTLNGAVNASVTSIAVRDVLGFASTSDTDDLIQVGSEYMLVTAGMGTPSWTVTRGYAGSTAASHLDGVTVTRIPRGWTDLTKVKLQGKVVGTTDDAFLLDQVDAANSWLTGEIGMFIGPSTDTSRTFNVRNTGRTLFIPGGLRSLTSLQVGTQTGGTLTTVTTSDVNLLPETWRQLDGLVYDRLEFLDITTSGIYAFYRGSGTAVVAGVFGPPEPPPVLSRIATTLAIWLFQSRQAGSNGVIGSPDTGEMIVERVLTPMDSWTIERYRNAVSDFSWV